MPRSHTLPRTVAAALAITALAAPAALARPVDLRSPDTKDAAAQADAPQDMRSPDTRDAATSPSAREQDLRHLEAGVQTSSLAGTTSDPAIEAALAQERYYATSVKAAPLPVAAQTGVSDGDGAPWVVFALGLAGAAVAGAGGASIAGKTRLRARRARVTA